jgi:hypothetical protein
LFSIERNNQRIFVTHAFANAQRPCFEKDGLFEKVGFVQFWSCAKSQLANKRNILLKESQTKYIVMKLKANKTQRANSRPSTQ